MPVVVTPTTGVIRLRVRANIRKNTPDIYAAKSRTLDAGTSLAIVGTATGTVVAGNGQWFALADGEFIWAGACDYMEADGGDEGADADRPDRRAFGDYVPPDLRTVSGIRHKARGLRPNGLEGLIVHFDAYRIRAAGSRTEDSDRRALDMLRSGEANGFHYVEISRTGKIFIPEGFSWVEWGYHAGTSKCPHTGRAGVSRFYVGTEMNNPGVLYPAQEDGVFCPWFNSQRNQDGVVILDGQGRCTRHSPNDEWFTADEVRFAPAKGNINAHYYLPYSYAQFEALTNLVVYLARKFPASFRVEQVLGHDEVAPTRKDDPGGALATPDALMTMDEFRTYLRQRI